MNIKFISLFMIALSSTGSILSYFIIGSYELTSAFIGWLHAFFILFLVTSARGTISNPESLINSYRHLVRQVVEEFGLNDISPIYIPSRMGGSPSLFLPVDGDMNPGPIPRRMVITSGVLGIRLETLGTYLLNELGGVSGGLSSAESVLKSALSTYLELCRDVEVIERHGNEVIVRVRKYVDEFVGDDPPTVNIYSQIVGPILAEGLDRVVKLSLIERDKRNLVMVFHIKGE